MTIRVAINGFGRIGRNVVRALYENGYKDSIQLVAINDLGDAATNAHLLKHDSIHGHFNHEVWAELGQLCIDGDIVLAYSERNPELLPWGDLDVDVVFECTGIFTSREKAELHLKAGAKKVLISAPGKDADATVVYGVNHDVVTPDDLIISNASCTTNCLAPVAQALNKAIGIEKGQMTTIHSVTNDQNLSDVYHSDLYRARASTLSMIPTKTGAAGAVGLVLPELAGRLDGMAVRVPTLNVSLVDFTFIASRDTTAQEVNAIMGQASKDDVFGVLEVNSAPLVSIDFNHNSASSIFDLNHTKVDGKLVKVLAWYDNEWGFSNRMLDNAKHMMAVAAKPLAEAS